jgi:AraC-like DNA-binding protein
LPAPELTGIARVPLLFLNRAKSFGVRPGQLLRAAGLRESDVSDPDGRVPLSKVREIWRAFIARAPSEAVGLNLGLTVKVRELGLVGYAMAHSSTLDDALRRFERYLRIINEALQCRIARDAGDTRIVMTDCSSLGALRHPVDARLSIILATAREITGASIVPVEVEFPYARPARLTEYRRAFAGARLAFDRPCGSIKLRARDMGRTVVWHDPTLGRYLDQLADQVARSLGGRRETFADKAARAIWPALSGGPPTLARTSSALRVSSRTLQRRLLEEGTTFAKVLESLRRELSVSLLHDRRLAISEIAFLLGYSEPSTFFRAFRRWRGVSPGRFRSAIG